MTTCTSFTMADLWHVSTLVLHEQTPSTSTSWCPPSFVHQATKGWALLQSMSQLLHNSPHHSCRFNLQSYHNRLQPSNNMYLYLWLSRVVGRCCSLMQCRLLGQATDKWLYHHGSRSHPNMLLSSNPSSQMQVTGADPSSLIPVQYCRSIGLCFLWT